MSKTAGIRYQYFVLCLQKLHIAPLLSKRSNGAVPPDNMSATAKLITKYVDRLRRLRSLQNAITVKEFRAITTTDSVRPTITQVIHSVEEAI